MRVLHLTRDFPPRVTGGVSVAVGTLVTLLRGRGQVHSVLSVDTDRKGGILVASPEGDAALWRCGYKERLEPPLQGCLAWRPTLVLVHDALLWRAGRALALGSGARCALVVHTLQRVQRMLRGLPVTTRSEEAQEIAFREADGMIFPSAWAYARAREGSAGEGQPGRDAAFICPLPVAPPDVVPDPTDLRVLWEGRFEDIKGVVTLRRAWHAVVKHHPTAVLDVAGGLPGTPRRDAWERGEWDALARSSGARIVLHGWLPAADLAVLRARATLVVAPSWCETFGLAVASAWAAGRPVVGTAVGVAADPELLSRGGWCVAPQDVPGLSAALVAALADPAECRLRGACARSIWLDRYAEASCLHQWSEALSALHG